MKSHKLRLKEDGERAMLGAVGTLMSMLHDIHSLPAGTDVQEIFLAKRERMALDTLATNPGLFRRTNGLLVHPNAMPQEAVHDLIVRLQLEHGTNVLLDGERYVKTVVGSSLPMTYVMKYTNYDLPFLRLGDTDGLIYYMDSRPEVRETQQMFIKHQIENIEIAYRNMLAFSVIQDCVHYASTWSQLYKWLPALKMIRGKFPDRFFVEYGGPKLSVKYEIMDPDEIDNMTIKRSQNPNATLHGRHFKSKRRMDNLAHVFAQLALIDVEATIAARKERILLHPKYTLGEYSFNFDARYR